MGAAVTAAAPVEAAVTVAAGGFAAALTFTCVCDLLAFGDFFINVELLGMRFVDGGLALLAGICGGLSAPV